MRRSLTRRFNLSAARTFAVPGALTPAWSALAGPRTTSVFPAGPSGSLSPLQSPTRSHGQVVTLVPSCPSTPSVVDINNPPTLPRKKLLFFFFLVFNCLQQQLPAGPFASEPSRETVEIRRDRTRTQQSPLIHLTASKPLNSASINISNFLAWVEWLLSPLLTSPGTAIFIQRQLYAKLIR